MLHVEPLVDRLRLVVARSRQPGTRMARVAREARRLSQNTCVCEEVL